MHIELKPVELLVLQPTPFCNLDCSYCYLGNRSDKRRMPLSTIASAVSALAEENLLSAAVAILWHAGEPLVVSREFYQDAVDLLKSTVPDIIFEHHLQTNGVLLDKEWISFFVRNNFIVGLSIDGPPQFHDYHRKTRDGNPTSNKVIRAAELLKQSGRPLSILCVLTKQTLKCPEQLFDFFDHLGVDEISFNVEEEEGGNLPYWGLDVRGLQEAVEAFLSQYYRLNLGSRRPQRIREFEHGLRYMFNTNVRESNLEVDPFKILTVGADGSVAAFSPELLGVSHENYIGFPSINCNNAGWLRDLCSSDDFKKIFKEVQCGVDACRRNCEYFSICGGGSPSNKLWENGTFSSTETRACAVYRKAVTNVMLNLFDCQVKAGVAPDKFLTAATLERK